MWACQSPAEALKEKPWGGWPKGDISLSPPEKDSGPAGIGDAADTVSSVIDDASGLPAPSTGTLLRRTYGSNNDEEALGLARTSDGGLALVGYTDGVGAGDRDLLLIRTDGCGVRKWTRSFGGAMVDQGQAVVETADGGLLALGQTASFTGGVDVYLVRTDAAGDAVWTATLGGAQADEGYALADAGDGSYVVVGKTYSAGPGGPNDHSLLAARVDDQGKALWQYAYGGGDDDAGYAVVAVKDASGSVGSFVIAGSVESWGQGDDDVWLVKLDAAGKAVWTFAYGGKGDDEARAIARAPDGGYIIAGFTTGDKAQSSDLLALKVTGGGKLQWFGRYGGAKEERAYAIDAYTGGYLLAGWSDSLGTGSDDGLVVRVNAVGDLLGSYTIGGKSGDKFAAMVPWKDGGWMLAGRTKSAGLGGRDAWLVECDAKGKVECGYQDHDAKAFSWATDTAMDRVKVTPKTAAGPKLEKVQSATAMVPVTDYWSELTCSDSTCP